jgi:hypothetical protein
MMKRDDHYDSLLLLKGKISKLRCYTREHDFISTTDQHTQIGITAIIATAMGMGAQAAGMVGSAASKAEKAHWLEFELDGKKIQGWVWVMPLGTGDNVEVVAKHTGGLCYTVYAIRRVDDGLVAAYPHVIAGRNVLYRNSVRGWLWLPVIATLLFMFFFMMEMGLGILFEKEMWDFMKELIVVSFVAIGLIAFRISRMYMESVCMAEAIFRTFGWPDVEKIDLRKTSKENPGEYKILGFGERYFRYNIPVAT